MAKRFSIEFKEAKTPIQELVTKFGGQPVWVSQPQWPVSKKTGEPMRFICQIAIDPILFGACPARMAYLFITDGDQYVDGTWEPDGGENAVILQPGSSSVQCSVISNGPTLYRMVKKTFRKELKPQPCEFGVQLAVAEDEKYVPGEERSVWEESQRRQYAEKLDGNKIGGTPVFLQADEFPTPGDWRLLLQLDSTNLPFYLNFGDAGMGYSFLSKDGMSAKFLWQCL